MATLSLLHSARCGLGNASTTAISATVIPWFERHQKRSTTLAIMGASFGAIAGVPAFLYAIERMGLSTGLLVVGLASGVVLIPLVKLVLRYRGPAELGLRRDGGDAMTIGNAGQVTSHVANALNTRRLLWSSTIAFALVLVMQVGFITHHVSLAQPRREFGAEAFGSAYGSAATVIQFVTAFGPALIGNLRGAMGGYPPAFLIAAVATAIGCTVLHFGGERQSIHG